MIVDKQALAKEWLKWTDGSKYFISHETVGDIDATSDNSILIKWIIDFPYKVGTIFVAANDEILYNMRILRPELDIRQAPQITNNEIL